jgi:hypothetical protein
MADKVDWREVRNTLNEMAINYNEDGFFSDAELMRELADAIKAAYVAGIDYANGSMYVESDPRARSIESGQEEP